MPVAAGATLEEALGGGEDYELLIAVTRVSGARAPPIGSRVAGLRRPIPIGLFTDDPRWPHPGWPACSTGWGGSTGWGRSPEGLLGAKAHVLGRPITAYGETAIDLTVIPDGMASASAAALHGPALTVPTALRQALLPVPS